jgi:hypothetical protein
VDDGRGFVVQPNPHAYIGHWGLVGMQERARSVNAEFSVHSEPGAGATVQLVIPYEQRGKRALVVRRRPPLTEGHDPAPRATDRLRLVERRLRSADERRGSR